MLFIHNTTNLYRRYEMSYILLLAGLFLLIKGADIFVEGAAEIAEKLRVPPLIIGLTVVSFGTSAPEAAIGISASIGGGGAISLGNVIGSNLFNLLMAIGITALAVPLTADRDVIRRDMPVNIFATGALAVIILDGKIVWYESLLLLGALGVYLAVVIKSALKNPIAAEERRGRGWLISTIMSLGGLAAVIIGGDAVVESAKTIAAHTTIGVYTRANFEMKLSCFD